MGFAVVLFGLDVLAAAGEVVWDLLLKCNAYQPASPIKPTHAITITSSMTLKPS
jgi:hypothetical protein